MNNAIVTQSETIDRSGSRFEHGGNSYSTMLTSPQLEAFLWPTNIATCFAELAQREDGTYRLVRDRAWMDLCHSDEPAALKDEFYALAASLGYI